jgi:hypothetical protein
VTATRVTAALSRAAQTLYSEARAHKRAEAQNRRRARDLMRQLDELRAECRARGIHLTIDTAEEAQSHVRRDP